MWMETLLPAEFKVLFLDSIFVILWWYLWLFFRARIANEKRLLAKRYRSERKRDRWQEWLKNLARQKKNEGSRMPNCASTIRTNHPKDISWFILNKRETKPKIISQSKCKSWQPKVETLITCQINEEMVLKSDSKFSPNRGKLNF